MTKTVFDYYLYLFISGYFPTRCSSPLVSNFCFRIRVFGVKGERSNFGRTVFE